MISRLGAIVLAQDRACADYTSRTKSARSAAHACPPWRLARCDRDGWLRTRAVGGTSDNGVHRVPRLLASLHLRRRRLAESRGVVGSALVSLLSHPRFVTDASLVHAESRCIALLSGNTTRDESHVSAVGHVLAAPALPARVLRHHSSDTAAYSTFGKDGALDTVQVVDTANRYAESASWPPTQVRCMGSALLQQRLSPFVSPLYQEAM